MSDDIVPEGLPETLPKGERILWQGRPDWLALAFAAFRLGWVAAYFAVLFVWRLASELAAGAPAAEAAIYAAWILPLAAAGLGLLLGLAWLSARTTAYTVTDRRVVMRIGVALPLTLNLPYARIDGADVRRRRGGTGDIAFTPEKGTRVGWAVLWPHARAWHFARPQPALRAVPNVDALATRISDALAGTRTLPMPAGTRDAGGVPAGLVPAE